MRVSLSRLSLVTVLGIGLVVSTAGGCRTGGYTGWSTPSWLSWNSWSKPSAPSTALAQNKPSTTVPRPSTTGTPQAVSSVAATTPGGVAGPGYTTSTGTYPMASYGTQPASAYQSANTANQVQPTVGYQTGPYSMSSTSPAGAAAAHASHAPAGYGTGAASAAYPAASQQTSASYGAAAYGASANGYRTADQRGAYNVSDSSPYSNDPSRAAAGQSAYAAGTAPAAGYGAAAGQSAYGAPSYGASPYGNASYGGAGYGAAAANAGYGAPSAAPVPNAATGAWSGYNQPSPAYDQRSSTQPAATQPATGYESQPASGPTTGNYGGYATTQVPTTPAQPASSNAYPSVPTSLAQDANSYRPGSTAGAYGVQNANYNQPAATNPPTTGYTPAGPSTYGNTYMR